MFLILDPETESPVPDTLTKELEALGCRVSVSKGSGETVLALDGCFPPEEVAKLLHSHPGIELLPIQRPAWYRARRARRRLTRGLLLGFGLLTSAALLMPVVGFLVPPEREIELTGPQEVAQADGIPPGAALRVRLRGKTVLIIHQRSGGFRAVGGTCTSPDPCRLEWDIDRQQLICPCHGGVYDSYGNVVEGPANIPLPRYEVTPVGSDLFLQRS